MTVYSRSVAANEWTGESDIIPLDIDEAKAWAEKHLSADEYIEAFGDVAE